MLVAVLVGCSSYAWRKPGATEAEFRVDDYACTKDARYSATKTVEEPSESGGVYAPHAGTIIYAPPPRRGLRPSWNVIKRSIPSAWRARGGLDNAWRDPYATVVERWRRQGSVRRARTGIPLRRSAERSADRNSLEGRELKQGRHEYRPANVHGSPRETQHGIEAGSRSGGDDDDPYR